MKHDAADMQPDRILREPELRTLVPYSSMHL
jgi:hypothetical protein